MADSSRNTPKAFIDSPGSRHLHAYVAQSLFGFGFGVGVSRTLFDLNPLVFHGLGYPISVVCAGLLGAVLLVSLCMVGRKARWLPDIFVSPAANISHFPLLLPLLSVFRSDVNPVRSSVLLAGGVLMWGAFQLAIIYRQRRMPNLLCRLGPPIALFVISLGLYLGTLAPTVGEADTFEFQVNVVRMAVSHGSGYPLYILLAKLFSLLPVGGSVAYRINLSAAVFGALAVVATYSVARRAQASILASFLASLALGVSFSVWSRAVEAEVYTLNLFLVSVILWLLLAMNHRPLVSKCTPVLFLTLGVSCANHLTIILIIPSVVIALLITKPSFSLRTWAISFSFFLAGLAIYLYLPIRWPAVNNGEVMTIERFMYFFTAQNARIAMHPMAFLYDLGRYGIVARKVLEQYGWFGIAIAMLGFASLARRHWPSAAITSLTYTAYVYFALSHYSPDPDFSSFLLPAHLVQVFWMALGLDAMIDAFRHIPKLQPEDNVPAGSYVIYTLFALLPLSSIWQNYDLVDQSNDWEGYRLGKTIMEHSLASGAAILADSEKMPPLYYLQVAEGVRPDLDIVVMYDEDDYRVELQTRISNGQQVYLGRYLPHLAPSYSLQSVGPLVEVNPDFRASSVSQVAAQFGEHVNLSEVSMRAGVVAAGEQLSITLAWQAMAVQHESYLVTFRLLDTSGMVVQTWPGRVPVGQMYPTNAWPLESIINDYHALRLDHTHTPGEYFLQVGLFLPFSDIGLQSVGTGEPWVMVAPITILPAVSHASIGYPTRIYMGDGLWLLGYDLPASVARGSPVDLVLHWMTFQESSSLVPIEIVQGDSILASIQIPTNVYPTRHPFATSYRLHAPHLDGNIKLKIGPTGQLAHCGWLALTATHCYLGSVGLDLVAEEGTVANFDTRIVLESLEVVTQEARPGESVVVQARWRSLRSMANDYTVFVHLLGPDGIVYGQLDTWPAQGTLPTSRWQPGKGITDVYDIVLDDLAPTGEYKLEIGWYLLRTLERLPLLGADGTPVTDKYLRPALVVR